MTRQARSRTVDEQIVMLRRLADLRFCDEVDWPAIMLTTDGIIYPSDGPRRA